MTVFEEIVLRQSIMLSGLSFGFLMALIFAVCFCYRGPSKRKTIIKVLTPLAFAVAGYVNFAAPLVVLGLLLSAIGDAFLSREGEKSFLIGLIAFAVAHVLYIAHFLPMASLVELAWFPVVLLVVLALSTERWLIPYTDDMAWPVRVYVLLITVMGCAALGLSGREVAVLGAFAFILSDLILAINLFRLTTASRWLIPSEIALWIFYVLGQAGILIGAGFARPLFSI
ncbi:lysoplasmalogenase [Roseovarius sp. EL26]|uniref:lysoplasmalogenase n=1 Tax=Roseovarius sp. EL26 TaxID=2126672 RepID=UPI000EA0B2D3|nr:lysoplasmalogenase [Roseovarius sp. EL26]